MHARITITIILALGTAVFAQSNIDPDQKHAWTENCGWTNWRDADDTDAGVIVDESFLSGYIWAENVGWINVGDGSPSNGNQYANIDSSDFGVNIDPDAGHLSGLAWGENIGWVNFDTSSLGEDQARLNACEGRFYGFAWGENIGWINLNDAEHFVGVEPVVCHPDVNGDCEVDAQDLAILLGSWGPCPSPCSADIAGTGDGLVGADDLAVLLGSWGSCP